MAEYKYGTELKQNNHTEFDAKYAPGTNAPNPGIYRCAVCGDEIGIAKGHVLPPQTHHQHAPGLGKIQWQLLVFAQNKQ